MEKMNNSSQAKARANLQVQAQNSDNLHGAKDSLDSPDDSSSPDSPVSPDSPNSSDSTQPQDSQPKDQLAELWGDVVSLKELVLSILSSSIFGFAGYFIAKTYNNPSITLLGALAGLLIACIINASLFKPKRIIRVIESDGNPELDSKTAPIAQEDKISKEDAIAKEGAAFKEAATLTTADRHKENKQNKSNKESRGK